MTRRPYRMVPREHPLLRVVQHDKPEQLKLRPEIEPRDPSWLVAVYGMASGAVLAAALTLLATC